MTEIGYAGSGPPMRLASLRRVLRRRAPIVAACALLGGLAALAAAALTPPRYTASASLRVEPQSGQTSAKAEPARPVPDQVMATQVQNLHSPRLAQTVRARLGLPVSEHNLRTEQIGGADLIQLDYTDADPVRAARIVNAYAQAFIDQELGDRRALADGAATLASRQIDSLRQASIDADMAVETYKMAHDLVGADSVGLAAQQVATLQQQLIQIQADEAAAQARDAAAHGQGAAGLDSPALDQLRQQRVQANQALAAQSGDPAQTARDAVAGIDRQIAQETSRLVLATDGDLTTTRQQRIALQAALAAAQKGLTEITAAQVGLGDLQRLADAGRARYDAAAQAIRLGGAQAAMAAGDLQVASLAGAPTSPSSPDWRLYLFLGLVAGIAAGSAIAILLQRWKSGLETAAQAEQELGLRFLLALPRVHPGAGEPIDQALGGAGSPYRRALVDLAAALSRPGAPGAVLALTSALPHEGKTTAAIGLARVMALQGRQVVMVDCDLRRRAMSLALSAPSRHGLVELLAGQVSLEAVLICDERSGAWLLPLAPGAELAMSLFATPAWRELIVQLRRRFDHIVLDTAPVLAVADTRVLARSVDVLALLVRWRVTPAKAARAAIQLIEDAGGRIAGVVLAQAQVGAVMAEPPRAPIEPAPAPEPELAAAPVILDPEAEAEPGPEPEPEPELEPVIEPSPPIVETPAPGPKRRRTASTRKASAEDGEKPPPRRRAGAAPVRRKPSVKA